LEPALRIYPQNGYTPSGAGVRAVSGEIG
jgi:hypothetical protein